ncbi:GFA family protein [Pseudomaricurvus alkylphenolicus]|uniref:GFA family protein n=1 Tax=Pseudomaricurvus alkylphenolicus TaxID=1306991 RepID=UPI00141D9D7D|nr:GFA family protein [Pseudomaricurvus alkylphenolicus]NIB38412.1 GFA family protein [Pseudomaricurvus alkylphenolicus]
MTQDKSITGGCLCGGVRYEVSEPLFDAGNCHCSMCRKFSGSAFSTSARVNSDSFQWLSGEGLLSRYHSSPEAYRLFCRQCGSSLAVMEGEKVSFVFLGSVSQDPGVRPAEHIFVGSQAPWYDIADNLLQYKGWPAED